MAAMLTRAKSAAALRRPVKDLSILEDELNHQKKKSALLDGDRKEFWKQAQNAKEKNKDTIEKLKVQNRRLKELRDQLMGTKKQPLGVRTCGSLSTVDIKDENYWRLALDRQRFDSRSKMKTLLQLQSMLKKVEDTKAGCAEESPLMKNIRVLENRLDKVMIKYNEAQSIKKTYQQIVKRLKEERVGYDNQLAAIERSLKGKEHDFEELLLLAHDATHAKQLAQMELKKYEHKKNSIQQLRVKYLEEKKSAFEARRILQHGDHVNNSHIEERQHRTEERENLGNLNINSNGAGSSNGAMMQDVIHYKQETSYQKQELADYEDAFRKLKEVTGVLDSNQIIQKFKTQSLTKASFADLSKTYEARIEKLKEEKLQIKEELGRLKLYGQDNSDQNKRHLDDLENQTALARIGLEKSKLKYERVAKILDNVKAGAEHLSRFLEFFKLPEHHPMSSPTESFDEPGIILRQINEKIGKIFKVVKNDPDYYPEIFKQDVDKIEEYFRAREPTQNQGALVAKNNRVLLSNAIPGNFMRTDEEDLQDLDLDDEAVTINYQGLIKSSNNNGSTINNNNSSGLNNLGTNNANSLNSSNMSTNKGGRTGGLGGGRMVSTSATMKKGYSASNLQRSNFMR